MEDKVNEVSEKENTQIKISLKNAIILGIVIGFCATISILFILDKITPLIQKQYEIKNYLGNEYYIIERDYSGEYDIEYISLSEYYDSNVDLSSKFEKQEIMDYKEYIEYCEEYDITPKYNDVSKNYIVFSYHAYGFPNIKARLADVEYFDNNVNLYVWDEATGISADISAYIITIPTEVNVKEVSVKALYTQNEYEKVRDNIKEVNYIESSFDKPIIYLYPDIETEVSVKLGNSENLLCSYPKYQNEGWNVLAKTNGDLIDLSTKRKLYSLYYESKAIENFEIENTGFIVKSEDTIKFLEEKLEILGLTSTEAEEFIIYWLPKLEANNYNYIRFESLDEINKNMPLNIEPKPDSIIRILMVFKGLEEPINVEEQELVTPERNGFVAVEWGGTEIK